MADLSVRLKLAAVWTALMFLFVYADLLSLFRPGELAEISAGNMGPVDVSQGSLLIAAVVVTIPALMIVFSAAAPFPLVRWLSLGVGAQRTLHQLHRRLARTSPNPRQASPAALAITDEASPFALRSTRNRPRRAVHQGCVRSRPGPARR